MIVNFKKLDPIALAPYRGSASAAGWDLMAAEDVKINPGETAKVHTGIAVELPEGYFGGIFARSGLATKHGLRPSNCTGVVDSDYRGEVIVALYNDSDTPYTVNLHERIAQFIVLPYLNVTFNEVNELNETARGTGGFGSTGK